MRGARAAFLEVSIGNKAARALYERAGFAPAGRRPRYYADGTDALVLRGRSCQLPNVSIRRQAPGRPYRRHRWSARRPASGGGASP